MCRRQYLRQLSAWAVVTFIAVAFLLLNTRYINNFIFGPFAIEAIELEGLSDANAIPHYFVRVTGARATDTGLRQISITTEYGKEVSQRESASIYGLEFGDKLLIVQSSDGQPLTVQGVLAPLPADIDSQLFDTPEMQASRNRFYPVYLNTTSFRIPGYIGIAVGLGYITLLIVFALPAWRRYKDPLTHKAVARVASWGDADVISAQIEQEHRQPHFKCGAGWKLTDNYIIRSSFFFFDVLRFDDLLWAYKRVTRHSVNMIPTGKTYAAVLVCKGGQADAGASQKKVDKILEYVSTRTPWAFFGYSDQIAGLSHCKPEDLAAAVEARKKNPPVPHEPQE
jgi:hypothetical protein